MKIFGHTVGPQNLQSLAIPLAGLLLVTPVACGGDDTSGDSGSSTSSTGGASTSSSSASSTTGPASSSSSSASGGGGMGGTGGGGFIPWDGDPPTLTIAPCTDRGNVVIPNPGNEGQLAAARLTPPAYPFQVTGIEYEIAMGDTANGDPCDATLPHRVEIYVDKNVVPSNTPTIAAQLDNPGTPNVPANTALIVKTDLTTPITLSTGDNLFVAVELAGTAEKHLCVLLCAGTGADDRNYWSNATMPPYNWATLASFNNDSNLAIGANGM